VFSPYRFSKILPPLSLAEWPTGPTTVSLPSQPFKQ
jgi:hypothetical protein